MFLKKAFKDFFVIILTVVAYYGLTHNPITHPEPKNIVGEFSIQKMQKPLVFGFAGHNYLVLKDANGKTVDELHGLATESKTGKWKYVGTNKEDILQVWQFKNSSIFTSASSFPGVLIFEGSESEALNKWNSALACKEKINAKQIPYPPFGVSLTNETKNSNSVAYTLIRCMGLEEKHVGLFTPGENVNLLEGN